MLRSPACENRQTFDGGGQGVGTRRLVSWTECGAFRPEKIEIKNDQMEISGRRLEVVFTSDGQTSYVRGGKTTIIIQNVNNADLSAAFEKIFIFKKEHSTRMIPEYWECYLSSPGDKKKILSCWQQELPADVFKIGSGITPPKPIFDPDPNYTPTAKAASLQGTSILSVIVTETGTVDRVQIMRPLGMGLDEEAIAAVRSWKFSPAKKEGHPVAVQVNIEINFHLY